MLKLCLVNREPVPVDPDTPMGRELNSPLATVALYEGREGDTGHRVLFAAEARLMSDIEAGPDESHPHIFIEHWQAIASYNLN